MFTCFACRKDLGDLQTLLLHIEKHKVIKKKGMFQCTVETCWKIFDNWPNFKKHAKRCYAKRRMDENISQNHRHNELYQYSYEENLFEFEEDVNLEMLKFVCGVSADMKTPRIEVFKTTSLLRKTFLAKVVSGIKNIIGPWVPTAKQDTMDYFVEILESSMDGIKTEARLNKTLSDLGLIEELKKYDVCELEKPKKSRKKRRRKMSGPQDVHVVDGASRKRPQESDNEYSSEESDYYEESDYCEEFHRSDEDILTELEEPEKIIHIKQGDVLIMPIEFQLKKFFELPHVFEKVKENTLKLQQDNKLNHYIKGTVWQEKIKKFKPGQMVIPFHFYGDGAQMNNPIGAHRSELQFNYITLPTIPSQYQSRLENYFVVQIYPAKHHQYYSIEQIYSSIICIFRTLWEKGVTLSINGEEITVYFAHAQFIGDTKEQNQRLGFCGSLSGTHCCRFCDMNIDDIRSKEDANGAIRRNVQNYDEDVATNNLTSTGVKEFSPFNRIPYFHVTEGVTPDLSHDLLEGILHPELALSILHFIDNNYFDLKFLNERMKSMAFGEAEKGNVPANITLKNLRKLKFKMTASEMFFFAHHLTLIIGARVPDDDEVWQHVTTILKFLDLCYLPEYDDQDIVSLKDMSTKLNRGRKELFEKTLQHKSHLICHYNELTKELGPGRSLQTIRYEGKHKEMKSYAKNINSRRNLPYSIGKKLQYKFAFRLLEKRGLEDIISVPKYRRGFLKDQEYYAIFFDDPIVAELSRFNCFLAKKSIINGITFSTELWLPDFEAGHSKIFEVVDIVFLSLNDIKNIYVVCKTYTNVLYDEHYACHRIDVSFVEEEMIVLNVNDYLTHHLYPVKIHKIGKSNFLFKRKHF